MRTRSSTPSRSSRSSTLDVFSIGDTVLDTFLDIQDQAVHCSLDASHCQITFQLGEKVPVEGITKIPAAGNASNAAIAARRLGLSSAIYATIGRDEAGRAIMKRWKEEHIDTRFVSISQEQETNAHTVLRYKGERTILIYHNPYPYALPKRLPSFKRVYYTSLGADHQTFERELLAHLEAHPEIRMTFQPGTHQLKRLARGLTNTLVRTDIIAMNREEAELFLEQPSGAPLHDQLRHLVELGPRIAVITDGEHGSYASDGKQFWFCASFPVPCLERTGAGDAFATTFTWAIDKGFSIPEAMRHATANSASVIQFVGPQAGLLSRDGLERLMRKYAQIQPTPLSL